MIQTDLNPLKPITNVLGGAFGAGANAVLDALSKWVAQGAANLLGSLATTLDFQTRPNLGASWFSGQYGTMVSVAILLALPFIFAAAITAVIRQDAQPLVRAVLVHLPLAGIGTGIAMQLTGLALAATDELCAVVASSAGTSIHSLFDRLARTLDGGVAGAGGFGVIVLASILAIGAFILSLEMIVRSAATYVVMLFLPVALAGLIWPSTARWGKRAIEMLTALILSKFVVVAVISLALAALQPDTKKDGFASLLTGAALLLLACASPFALLRMAPVVEAGAIAHLDGAGRRAAGVPGNAVDAVNERRASVEGLLKKVGSGPPPRGSQTVAKDPLPAEAPRTAISADGTQEATTGTVPTFRSGPGGSGPGGSGPGGSRPGGSRPGGGASGAGTTGPGGASGAGGAAGPGGASGAGGAGGVGTGGAAAVPEVAAAGGAAIGPVGAAVAVGVGAAVDGARGAVQRVKDDAEGIAP